MPEGTDDDLTLIVGVVKVGCQSFEVEPAGSSKRAQGIEGADTG
jgi:hypothetical protein